MKKTAAILMIAIVSFVCFSSALSSSFEYECASIASLLRMPFSLYGELEEGMENVWDLDDGKIIVTEWNCEEDEFMDMSTEIVFLSDKAKNHLESFYLMFGIEDSLYSVDVRYEQISSVIRYILFDMMGVETRSEIANDFQQRLLQYLFEESKKPMRYRHNGLSLLLEYDPENFFVYLTLE